MTLDQYQLCPCGSGKKIKFCCSRDIVHDLDRVLRMLQGNQRLAAIEKIDALLEQHHDRPALLSLKLESQLELNERDAARATLARWLEVDADNVSARAMQSLAALVLDSDLTKAVNYLQDAFERVNNTVTPAMYRALLTLAQVLNRVGLMFAAKGHLQLAVALTKGEDDRAAQMLMEFNQSRSIPQILRESLSLRSCPANVTWRIEFDSAMREVFAGKWRLASQHLSAMAIRILDEPAILYNLAVVYAWLGDNANSVKAWRDFARIREVPLDERVRAMALVEYLATDGSYSYVLNRYTFEVESIEPILERFSTAPSLVAQAVTPDEGDNAEPGPRAAFKVLDREAPKDAASQTAEGVPFVSGFVLLYGKQTDRSARVELECLESALAPLQQRLSELGHITWTPPVHVAPLGRSNWVAAQIVPAFHYAPGTTIDQHRQLDLTLRRKLMYERFADTKLPFLGDKTPREAMQDSRLKTVLLGALLNVELGWGDEVDLNPLRKEFGLPEIESLDPATCDFEHVPVDRLVRLDVSRLNDDQLLLVYRRSYAVMAIGSLRKIALEVAQRSTLDDKIDKVEAYDILSDLAANSDEALAYLDKARKLATKEGESPAAWMVDELEIRLTRGEFDRCMQLFNELKSRYMKEPGIGQSILQLFARYGLLTPDGQLIMPSGYASDSSKSDAGKIWTPDAEPAAEASGGSKLWVPGMD